LDSIRDLKRPLQLTSPVMLSYIAIGLACGVVLVDSGFTIFQILLISIFVYSGAGQFLIASMVLLGASIPSIILTTLFLNMRSVLMSASVAEYVKNESNPFLFLFGITLTDESYGLNFTYFQNDDWQPKDAMAINLINYAAWVISCTVGGAIGSVLQFDTAVMSFAIVGLFISMAVNQFISKIYIITGAAAVILTILFNILLGNHISIVIGAVLASFIGYFIELTVNKREGGDSV